MRTLATLVLVLLIGCVAGCRSADTLPSSVPSALQSGVDEQEVDAMENMRIRSTAFDEGGLIPRKYTCQGQDVSPPLEVSGVPGRAVSLVLIMDDPDAPMGTWGHWVVWNIAPSVSSIAENSTPAQAVVGRNSWPRNAYGGPCPPSGMHRYFFRLYALDVRLELANNSGKREVEAAMRGHVLATAQLMGRYAKS